MTNILFHQLHLALKFELDSVENRLNQLLAGDYPTGSAVSFMRRLLTDLQDQRARVLQILHDLAIDPKGAFDRLVSEHRKLILRSPTLVYLENAQTLRVPWSLVPSIETLAKNLLPGRLADHNHRRRIQLFDKLERVRQPQGPLGFSVRAS